MSEVQTVTKLDKRARNVKVMERALKSTPEVKNFSEKMKRMFKLDMFNEAAFPVMNEGFSWTALRNKLELKEADASGTFVQFLKAGLQVITNNAYLNHPTTYEEWVHVIQSNKDTEPYAPNHGVAFPRQVGNSELFPEVGAAALDLQIKNLKFGAIYAIERELLEDDQSGSFQMQSAKLGEYMKLLVEVLCYGKLASVSGMQYIDYAIPVSETKPSGEANYPWTPTATPFIGGGFNRATTFALPTRTTLQNAKVALLNQKNLQGIKMNVTGNRLICGPNQEFDVSILLNSAFYPSGAATAGVTGGAFAINPIKGFAKLTVSPYVFKNDGTVAGDSFAWYLVDDTKPFFVLQLREAMTVEQEAVNSGESFGRDIYRFKGRSRMNADWIDPRFAWQGNDGSVTS
jgi:phage major head subunit gpT-like protein